VSDCNPFGQGINMRPRSDVRDIHNQSNISFYMYSSIYFSTTSSPCIFFLLLTSSEGFFESISMDS